MLKIGLTGGVATGKSSVAKMFEKEGAFLIDMDKVAREVVKPGARAWEEIVKSFGRDILLSDGNIDRKKLGAIIFNDISKRRQLEDITHPVILKETDRLLDKIYKKDPKAIVVIEIPLLIEKNLMNFVDVVVLVYVPTEIQLKRLTKRDKITIREAREKIKSQIPIDEKVPLADYIVNNEGSLYKTCEEVKKIYQNLIKLVH